ncbi:AI-2E family transporter [Phototrophicus methaneseepsis]|uniref:AI-2E family transporter n=1 Tax=Phototrophicus methaneseepsis TaxID=2710758 RepID=A0A7S8IG02_9CHLR|nr:AI-2E family transporter [Phototrophicus methaneseepsis]QPC84132.1 AI-2E family transporter [Phototrophicus methaneseepsis]
MTIDGGSKLVRWVVSAIIGLIFFALFVIFQQVILLLLTAVLVALILDLPIQALNRMGLSRRVGTPLVLGVVILALVGINIIAAPILVRQGEVLVSDTIPRSLRQFDSWWRRQSFTLNETLEDMPLVNDMNANDLTDGLSVRFDDAVASVVNGISPVISGALSTVFSLLVILFAVIFLLAEPHVYMNGFLNLVPPFYRERAENIIFKLDSMLRYWISAMAVSMVLLGVGVWIGLQALNVPQAFTLSIIAGATSFIPNFGPIIAVIPAAAVAFATEGVNPLVVIVVIYFVTFLQNQILLPILMSNAVNIPPLAILFGQIIFGLLFGFMGLLLAVPLTVIVGVLINEVYVQDLLGYKPQQVKQEVVEEDLDDNLDAETVSGTA